MGIDRRATKKSGPLSSVRRKSGPFSSVRRGEGWDEESGKKWPVSPTLSRPRQTKSRTSRMTHIMPSPSAPQQTKKPEPRWPESKSTRTFLR